MKKNISRPFLVERAFVSEHSWRGRITASSGRQFVREEGEEVGKKITESRYRETALCAGEMSGDSVTNVARRGNLHRGGRVFREREI